MNGGVLGKHWKKPLRDSRVAGLLLLLPFLVILPNLDTFPYPRYTGAYSDITVSHYPNAYFLRQELLAHRPIPLWSPTILSGYPFIANPLSGLLYPPGWLGLLLPIPAGFHVVIALHLVLGGVGMLRLLRAEGMSYPAALFGGMAFELMPKIAAHYGAGHLTLLYALAWTPWLLLTWTEEKQRVDKGYESRRWIKPSLVLTMIILADVRWAAFATLLLWAYAIAHSHYFLVAVRGLTRQTGLAVLLSAPLSIPLIEFILRSSRTTMTAADRLTLSLSPARILGFIFPDFGGFHEWALYPGAVTLCLALVAIAGIRHKSGLAFWIWVAVASTLVALGSYIPGMQYLARLPGFSLLRVPARALFITGLAIAALAGYGLEALIGQLRGLNRRVAKLVLAGLVSFALVLAAGVRFTTLNISLSFLWGAGITLLSVLWIMWCINGVAKRFENFWFVGLFAIAIIDWTAVDRSYILFRPFGDVQTENAASAEWLASKPGLFRVYSPSYSIPQATAAHAGLQLADGVDPLQLENYVRFMEQATGVPRIGYSVTMPPFADGGPISANSGYVPDASMLGMLNVRYVASAFDLTVDGLEFKTEIAGTRLYENMRVLPRAWIQPANALPGEQASPATVDDWRPNRITAETQGPGLFVLSEVYYPGWIAYVDGEKVPIEQVAGLLRGVALESGRHQIVFQFVPWSFYVGLIICILGLTFYIWELNLQRAKQDG